MSRNCCSVKLSELKYSIQVMDRPDIPDGCGGFTRGDEIEIFSARAKIVFPSGSQVLYADAMNSKVGVKFIIRYRSDFAPQTWQKYWVLFRGERYNIRWCKDLSADRRWIEITGESGVSV